MYASIKTNTNVLTISIVILLFSLQSNAFQTDSLNNNFEQELLITYQKLKEGGYVPMPAEMQNILLVEIKNEIINNEKKNVYSLFSKINSEENHYTLSNNIYPEILTTGNHLTTHNPQLTTHTPQPTTIIDPVSFALSIDPLSDQFPATSPYVAMGNNPVHTLLYLEYSYASFGFRSNARTQTAFLAYKELGFINNYNTINDQFRLAFYRTEYYKPE
jgi:hypothetical protein